MPTLATRFGLLSIVLLLSACNLAPKYDTPAMPTLDQYKYGSNTGKSAAAMGWEDFFNDPQLKALIKIALANNRDMRIAIKNVEAAKAQYGISLSALLPTIGLAGEQNASKTPSGLSATGQSTIQRRYSAGIAMNNFEIDFFGKIRNQSEAALQSFYATEQAQRTAHISLVAAVANSYLTLRSLQALERFVKASLTSYSHMYTITRSRFKAGVASMLDVNQAQASYELVKSNLAEFMRQQAQTKHSLVLLLGQEIPANLPQAMPFGANILIRDIPVGLPSDLLQYRPDIIAAEHQLKAANANIGAARAAFFPSISLTGLFGSSSLDLSNLFTAGHKTWSFTPRITAPIFASGSLRNNLKLSEIRKDIQIAHYEKTIQIAFKEVNDALSGIQTYQQQIEALRAQTTAVEHSLHLSKLRYTNGIDSFLTVQSAQLNLLNTKKNVIAVGLASLLNKVALYKALGGGWKSNSIGGAIRATGSAESAANSGKISATTDTTATATLQRIR